MWRRVKGLCDRCRAAPPVDPEIRRAEKAIARLPDITREVFLLHRFEDMRYEQIAGRLDIDVREVEAHIAAALVAVRRARKCR